MYTVNIVSRGKEKNAKADQNQEKEYMEVHSNANRSCQALWQIGSLVDLAFSEISTELRITAWSAHKDTAKIFRMQKLWVSLGYG